MTRIRVRHPSPRSIRLLALCALLTVAAAWLWAHEGHDALPTRGATPVKDAKGEVIGVNLAAEALRALDVTAADVTLGALKDRLIVPATVVVPWDAHAYVAPRLGGQVAALLVKPGQLVAKGEPVAELASLELADLQRELLDARTESELAAKNLAGLEAGARRGSIPETDVREAAALHRQRLDAFELARSRLLGIGITPDAINRLLGGDTSAIRTVGIRSPVAGRVDHLDVYGGQVVDSGANLMEIIDPSRVWVRLGVLEKDLHRVAPGQAVTLHLAGRAGSGFPVRITVAGQYLEPHARLAETWADCDNADGQLRPGMTGHAEITLPSTQPGLIVPAGALVEEGAERFVLVEIGPGQYRRQNVVVEARRGDAVEVARDTGLFPGDRVVVAGSHELASFFPHEVLRLSTAAERAIGLCVEPARRRQLSEVIDLTGALELPQGGRSLVSSRVAGIIQHVAVGRDQEVRAGDVVAELFSPDFLSTQFELLRVESQARLHDERLRWLKQAAGSERTVRETEAALTTARQRVEGLGRKLREMGLSEAQQRDLLQKRRVVETLAVRARSAGRVVRFAAVLGQAIKAEDPLVEIQDRSRVLLRLHVPAQQLPFVHVGSSGRVRLLAAPDYDGEAVIVRSGQMVDPASRTVPVWAEFRTPPKPPPPVDATARLELTVAEGAAALAVPVEAIAWNGSAAFVFVRGDGGTFERRAVQTGRDDGRFVEVRSGLNEGESIAVRGVAELQTAYAALR